MQTNNQVIVQSQKPRRAMAGNHNQTAAAEQKSRRGTSSLTNKVCRHGSEFTRQTLPL